MKAIVAILFILSFIFMGVRLTQTPTVETVGAVQQANMRQFSNDVAAFMQKTTGDLAKIKADCKANQGVYGTRCWVTITGPDGNVSEATAENVRRRGDKFVWDHES